MNSIARPDESAITPSFGLVTWDAEGTEGGRFQSRKLSVPSNSSGLTIGRGYDMKERKPHGIIEDLTDAEITFASATILSNAAGLTGVGARAFIVENKLHDFEISKVGQKKLFVRTYLSLRADVQRICEKADVVAKYGQCNWLTLNSAIIDILVDLRFRGDFTGAARGRLQKFVVANDLAGFAFVMFDPANWANVPKDRFNRRVNFLKPAVLVKNQK